MAELLDNPIFEEILRRYIARAEQVIAREVDRQGLVLTAEMLNSIRVAAIEKGKGFISASLHYEMLLRLKDIKQLNYSRTPPLKAMIEYVEKVGLENFSFIPGYPNGVKKLGLEKKIERVARSIRQVYKTEPNVKRGYRGVYNDPLKNYVLPNFFHELRIHAGATALSSLRALIDG